MNRAAPALVRWVRFLRLVRSEFRPVVLPDHAATRGRLRELAHDALIARTTPTDRRIAS